MSMPRRADVRPARVRRRADVHPARVPRRADVCLALALISHGYTFRVTS